MSGHTTSWAIRYSSTRSGLRCSRKHTRSVPVVSFIATPFVETFQFVSAITVSHECGRRQAPAGELELRGLPVAIGSEFRARDDLINAVRNFPSMAATLLTTERSCQP